MRTRNRRGRRVLRTCGFIAVFAVGFLALSGATPARRQNQSQPVSKPIRVRIGGDVPPLLILSRVAPVYPTEAKKEGASGTVVLHEVIGSDGSVLHLDFVSGPPVFEQAAIHAVKQWTYEPMRINGEAVEVDTTVTVRFDLASARNASLTPQAESDPWTVSETVMPADLEKELSDPDPAKRPIVACVGFKFLYDGGHVPGASYHGPASKPEGLADLQAWARSLPKSSNVVLYCGCCPMVRCPNLRPAFTAMHDAGFARLRVLLLPTNFATDWAGKGYPIEKGK